jgi:hypothetical protein
LTENKSNISIHLLDLGYENIAYNDASEKAYIIDVENVIPVDRTNIDPSK